LNPRLAFILSVILHPLLMPTYIFGVLFLFVPELIGVSALDLSSRGSLLALLFLSTFAAPSLAIYYLYRMGFFKSLTLDNLKDRRIPYWLTIAIYAGTTYLFGWQLQPINQLIPGIAIILGSITVALIIVALISTQWKISAHATGIGGLTGALACLMINYDETRLLLPCAVSIAVTGTLLTARLQLNAHTPAQVTAGLILGLATSVGSILFFF
jgi:membrane-associated phospholipid phosphatase